MSILKLLFFLSSAHANFFSMEITDYGIFAADAQLQAQVDTVVNDLVTEINSELPDLDQSNYLVGMANSNAIAAKGSIDSPLSNFKYVSVGLVGGLGVDLGDNSLSGLLQGNSNLETFGAFGGFFGLAVGLPGRWVGLDHVMPDSTLTVGLISLNQSFQSVQFEMSHFSARWSFPVYPGKGERFRWTGVRVSTGLEYAKAKVVVESNINQSVTGNQITVGSETYDFDAEFNQSIEFGADVTTYSIPAEVSTGGEIFKALGGFVGLGLDLNFGSAKSIINGGGPVTFVADGGSAGTSNVTAVGSINAGSKEGPRTENLRLFYGMNLDMYLVNFHLQVNQMLLNSVYGVSAGLRVLW